MGALALSILLLIPLTGCVEQRPVSEPVWPPRVLSPQPRKVDLLLVIDNSGGMEQQHQSFLRGFPKLLDALRADVGAGGELPDLRVGVISSDLGAGDYALPSCEEAGGDRGRLQVTPRLAGCTPPSDPWVAFAGGQTNVPGCTGDAASCLHQAVRCIGHLGISGCGFEHHLESMLWALDPVRDTNPGFLRDDALLVVAVLGDEDDCSAARPELFDPADQRQDGPLGPLTSFRCFEHGIRCDINDRHEEGPREDCVPKDDWLYPLSRYRELLVGLKGGAERVIVTAIAGPPTVSVGHDGPNPTLKPACQSQDGFALPAIRTGTLVRDFRGPFLPICAFDYGPFFERLGRRIARSFDAGCLLDPLLTTSGGLACHPDLPGCGTASCLAEADCTVTALGAGVGGKGAAVDAGLDDGGAGQAIPRCEAARFAGPITSDGPLCWRLSPRPQACEPSLGVAPYALELQGGPKPSGALELRCRRLDLRYSDVPPGTPICGAPDGGQKP